HERVPEVFPILGGEVNLPARLADEADAQQDARHAGHLGPAAGHVGEGAPAQVTVGQRLEQGARLRAGDVHGRVAAGDVGDVHAPAGAGGPPLQPLVDELGVAGGRGGEEVV